MELTVIVAYSVLILVSGAVTATLAYILPKHATILNKWSARQILVGMVLMGLAVPVLV
jgi:hypothetical protein